jgi:hypothetical protein
MISNTTIPAPISVLAFLALSGTLVIGALAVIALWFSGKQKAAWLVAKLGMGVVASYAAVLLAVSAMSHENVLRPDQEKYFCELDCHLAYSIAGVKQQTDTSGNTTTYVVTLRTYFDPGTISPQRPKDAPLLPNPRDVSLVDKDGHIYLPISSSGTAIATSLKPGDSYSTDLVFHVQQPLAQPRLLVTSSGWPERWLIGSEQSWLHGKTYFGL